MTSETASGAIARSRSLSLRIALLASAFVLAASLLVGGYVIVEARAVMHARAAAALDSSMRLLKATLQPEGEAVRFSIEDGRLKLGERVIDEREASVDQIERVFGGTATIFLGDVRVATSVRRANGERAVGTKLAQGPVHEAVLGRGAAYHGEADILGVQYQTLYEPIRNAEGGVIGVLYVGRKTAEVLAGLDRITTQAALVGAAIVLLSLLLLWIGLRRTLQPLNILRSAMDGLAHGLTETDVPYRARRDEIGAMAGAVQVFKDSLIRTNALEEETKLARASAEEQRKVGMRQIADDFESAVSGVIGSVTSAATELEATARSMSGTANATAQQSGTVASAAADAAGNVQTVAAAAEELGASVQEIARQVAGSSSLAQQAEADSDQTTRLVSELSQAADQIGAMVGLISNIAGQTNLLALNATIEAARAGEAGRGFAVVAAEVKELASQTARATDEIGQRIGQIQGVTVKAVGAIDGIGKRIREINAVAGSIAAAVEQQGAATQEIVRNVAQASTGTSEVTSNIAGVARSSEETGAAASQVLGAAHELSRQSEQLRTEIGRFLSTVRAA